MSILHYLHIYEQLIYRMCNLWKKTQTQCFFFASISDRPIIIAMVINMCGIHICRRVSIIKCLQIRSPIVSALVYKIRWNSARRRKKKVIHETRKWVPWRDRRKKKSTLRPMLDDGDGGSREELNELKTSHFAFFFFSSISRWASFELL